MVQLTFCGARSNKLRINGTKLISVPLYGRSLARYLRLIYIEKILWCTFDKYFDEGDDVRKMELFHFKIQEPFLRIAIDFRSLLNTAASEDVTCEENVSCYESKMF